MKWMCAAVLAAGLAAPAKTRLAHIGLELDGSWSWIQEVRALPDAELAGIADPHPDLLDRAGQAAPGARLFPDWKRMLDEIRPKGVTVTVPNKRHLEVVRECARRGIHVWFQKPLAASGSDAREMERVAREARITLMASYHTMWSGPMRALVERVGSVGTIRHLEVRHAFPASKVLSPYYERQFLNPELHGGGALVDQGTYGLSYAVMLLGKPSRVFATARILRPRPGLTKEDDVTVVLDYPNGATAVIQGGWWAEPDGYGEGFTRVAGSAGELVRNMGQVTFTPARGKPEAVPVPPMPANQRGGIAHFVECLETGRAVAAPHSAAMNVVVNEIVDAAYESIRTGRAVMF